MPGRSHSSSDIISTPGILLRRFPYGDTSLIIHWLTRDYGRLKTIAKGARPSPGRSRKSHKLAGKLDLFFLADLSISRSATSELHILRELELNETHSGLRQVYRRTEAAAYFIELLEMVTELEAPVPELFSLFQRAINYLNEKDPEPRAILHFEKELCVALGLLDPSAAPEHRASPAELIFRTYHRLPKGRTNLMI